jgi:formylglycine-generating enzyme required for sulfatase activity
MNNPLINAQPATVAVTGARPRCKSDDGIYDMVGNLHEWTADPAGTFQGGAYSGKIALGCQYVTTAHGFSYHDYSTGFRCCTDPL